VQLMPTLIILAGFVKSVINGTNKQEARQNSRN